MERFKLVLTKQKDGRWFCLAKNEVGDNFKDESGNDIDSCLPTPSKAIASVLKDLALNNSF